MKQNIHKHLPLLFSLGIVCLAWASVTFYVEQRIDFVSIALLLIGLVSLLLCFITKGRASQGYLHSSSWKKIGIVIAAIVFSLLFIVGINYFTYSLPYRWDVTQTKQHTLTASTIAFIKAVDKPVELTALYVGLPPKYLEDLLAEYERISNGNIKTEIIDPIAKIGYAA